MYELLLFFGLVVIGYSINKSIETSVLVSLIITSLYAFFRKNNLKSEIREGMKSGSKKKKKPGSAGPGPGMAMVQATEITTETVTEGPRILGKRDLSRSPNRRGGS